MAQKISAKNLVVLKGKDGFRKVDDGYVAELIEVLKASGDKWPFPTDEHSGIKVMPATREVKEQGQDKPRIEETGDFIVISGSHRVTAAQAVKWGEVPVTVVRPKTPADILKVGIRANVEHGRRFKVSERDELIKRCIANGMNQTETADLFQISTATVSRVVRGVSGESTAEKKAKGGKAKKGKKKGTKKAKDAFSVPGFFDAMHAAEKMIEKHHDSLVAFAAGDAGAAKTLERLASSLLTLHGRAMTAAPATETEPEPEPATA